VPISAYQVQTSVKHKQSVKLRKWFVYLFIQNSRWWQAKVWADHRLISQQ